MNFSLDKSDEENNCLGLAFRAQIGVWIAANSQHLHQRISLRLVKSKSCPGCEDCFRDWEMIQEEFHNLDYNMETSIFYGLENGKLYRAAYIPDIDWETQIDEGGFWEMHLIKEKK